MMARYRCRGRHLPGWGLGHVQALMPMPPCQGCHRPHPHLPLALVTMVKVCDGSDFLQPLCLVLLLCCSAEAAAASITAIITAIAAPLSRWRGCPMPTAAAPRLPGLLAACCCSGRDPPRLEEQTSALDRGSQLRPHRRRRDSARRIPQHGHRLPLPSTFSTDWRRTDPGLSAGIPRVWRIASDTSVCRSHATRAAK